MKVRIAGKNEPSIELSFNSLGDSVYVQIDDTEYFLVEFRVSDGKLVVVRNTSVADPRVKTDSVGRIVEVPE